MGLCRAGTAVANSARGWAITTIVLGGLVAAFPPIAEVQSPPATFKIAYYNIQSGFGEPPLSGISCSFSGETSNCTDPSKPLNAWGKGVVQAELQDKIGNDPAVLALGLGEAWNCGTPAAVQEALGWAARSSERNGVAIVARYGFAGPEEWQQLDTSLNANPADTKWVLRVPVCADSACSKSVIVFTAHWYSNAALHADVYRTYDTQAQQTLDFMSRVPLGQPHVLVGDLNVFDGTNVICGQSPKNGAIQILRDGGYLDAWSSLHSLTGGETGMWNRAGCGVPEGNLWKRIDYGWSKHSSPLSMTRFGMVEPGQCAPSDHAGVIVEYAIPGAAATTTAPLVDVREPVEAASVAGAVSIKVEAFDDNLVTRVELLIDNTLAAVRHAAPFEFPWNTAVVPNGVHTIQAAASDAAGHRTLSALRTVYVDNPVVAGSEIVLRTVDATAAAGAWRFVDDSTAAAGRRLQNRDAGAAKLTSPSSSPADYFELTFSANAGTPYRVWLRGKAEGDSPLNDSVYLQFSGSVDASGTSMYRIGTSSATTVNVEECDGCLLSGWGWQDNGRPKDVLGPVIYFATTGTQRLRVQVREDGLGIDQIVLSAVQYMKAAPGAFQNDSTILGGSAPPTPNAPPTVTLTSPANGSTFTAPADIALAASASDSDGSIARVEFYSGSALLGSSTTSPYGMTWSSVPAGSYTLTARAVDSGGAVTVSSAVSIEVVAASTGGTQARNEIVLHASTAPVVQGSWTVTPDDTAAGGALLQNPDVGAAKLSSALASPSHFFELTFTADAGKAYRLWLRGKAQRDHYSNDSVFVQFDNSTDAGGSAVYRIGTTSGAAVVLEECSGCHVRGWGWQDNGYGTGVLGDVIYFVKPGTQRVRIQVREDGLGIDQVVLSAEKYIKTSPGSVKDDTTILPATDSSTTSVNAPPTVAVTSPADGSTYVAPASIDIAASASDSDGSIARVDFYAGTALVGSATSSPYAVTWSNVAAGTYSLTARATDNAGAVTTSAPVSVQVSPAANVPPTVTLTSPADGSTYVAPANIDVAASASDSDGSIARVDFYAGTALIGSATASPYAITWSNVAAGTYSLTARATDNAGAVTTSAAVSVHVLPVPNAPPIVALTSPAEGSRYVAPASIDVAASGTDSDGSIARVDFLAGTALIGSATSSPYAVTWSNVAAGTYSLTARATDNAGAVTTSAPVSVQVSPAPNAPPTVTLTSPANGSTFTAPADVALAARASDSDGSITRVEFYSGTTLLGSSTTSPYGMTWSSVPAGSYTLTARAVDSAGAVTVSAAVSIEVVAASTGGTQARSEIVLYASTAPVVKGSWTVTPDGTGAGGARLQNPDAGAAKLSRALASPSHFFELTFTADAGKAYRLWLRGKAQRDHYSNDSVFVQFDNSTDAKGSAVYRIGTTSATAVVLEECSGCHVRGWGWQDNGYGTGVLGPVIYFAKAGTQRVRIQVREDGLGIDQIVLSAEKYITASPGSVKDDTTILPATESTTTTADAAPTAAATSPADGSTYVAPASLDAAASASDSDGSIARADFYADTALVGSATTSRTPSRGATSQPERTR